MDYYIVLQHTNEWALRSTTCFIGNRATQVDEAYVFDPL